MIKKFFSFIIISLIISIGFPARVNAENPCVSRPHCTCNETEIINFKNVLANTQIEYISQQSILDSLNKLKKSIIENESLKKFLDETVAKLLSLGFKNLRTIWDVVLWTAVDIGEFSDFNRYKNYLETSTKNGYCGVVAIRQEMKDPKTREVKMTDQHVIPQIQFLPTCCLAKTCSGCPD